MKKLKIILTFGLIATYAQSNDGESGKQFCQKVTVHAHNYNEAIDERACRKNKPIGEIFDENGAIQCNIDTAISKKNLVKVLEKNKEIKNKEIKNKEIKNKEIKNSLNNHPYELPID